MNLCSYTKVRAYDYEGINDRFKLLFRQVCYLTNTLSQGVYATNAAALSGGLKVGQYYNTSTGELRIVV